MWRISALLYEKTWTASTETNSSHTPTINICTSTTTVHCMMAAYPAFILHSFITQKTPRIVEDPAALLLLRHSAHVQNYLTTHAKAGTLI